MLHKKTCFLLFSAAMTLIALAEDPLPQATVGDHIPDVTLLTAESTALTLQDAVKTKPAVLVFYRGGWCPFCNRYLMALAKIEKDLAAAGCQILAISPDQPAKIAETPDRENLSYTLLSDSKMETATAFGISFQVPADLVAKYKSDFQIDLEAASGKTHHLLPHPAVFIVDQKGLIRFAHVNPDYKTRLDPAEILKTVRELEPALHP